MTDRIQLETALSEVAGFIDWPDPPAHLPTRVAAHIEADRAHARYTTRGRLVIALSVAAVIVGTLIFSPLARQAVADLFGAAGIRIGFTSDPPPAPGAGLDLGDETVLADVEQQVDFVLRQPEGAEPGAPDTVYLREDGQVNMVWRGDRILPAAGDTGVALLLTQSNARNGKALAYKGISSDTEVHTVVVEGVPALWIEGAPHTFTLLDAEGRPLVMSTRLAANVLLWETNGVNHRVEITGDLDTALAVAESLVPVP